MSVIKAGSRRLAVIFILAMVAGALDAAADSTLLLGEWSNSLFIDPRVVTEVNAFEHDDQSLPNDYAAAFTADLRRAVFAAANHALERIAAGDIAPFVEVSYPEPGFARHSRAEPDDDVTETFEEGFVRTEGLAFFENDASSPVEAMTLYTSRDFQMAVSSRIERIWNEGGLSCIEVKGVKALLDPTMACNKIDRLVEDGIAAEHSQVVSNGVGEDYQRVFFKESLKTFVAIPGGIAVHYINYTRSARLGSVKRKLGKGKIRESQERRFEELGKLLSGDG